MKYSRFLSLCTLLVIAALTIYVGCVRSYAVYFFERETKRIVFLEPWSAATVPIALSFLLILSYLSAKRQNVIVEEAPHEKAECSASNLPSRKISRSSDLESISEKASDISAKPSEATAHSMSQLSESSEEEPAAEEPEGADGDQTEKEVKLEESAESTPRRPSTGSKKDSEDEDSTSEDDGLQARDIEKIPLDNLPPSRRMSTVEDEIEVQRKQSRIYKQIGQIKLLPFSMKMSTPFERLKTSSFKRIRKESLFDIFFQLIGIHVPLWMSVIALHVTLVEVFNMKFYYQFYYHYPGMKLLAMLLSISIGLFHEFRSTWLVNNILGIAAAYVIIARVETASYIAGIVLLIGMAVFDLFWSYGIDLFSTVTTQSQAPLMVIIPWGKDGKREMLATLDIIVPGIFLNVLFKFGDMYDPTVFLPSFYAALFGLALTFALAVYREKSTPAMVLPMVFTILTSLLCANRPLDLWRFEIRH